MFTPSSSSLNMATTPSTTGTLGVRSFNLEPMLKMPSMRELRTVIPFLNNDIIRALETVQTRCRDQERHLQRLRSLTVQTPDFMTVSKAIVDEVCENSHRLNETISWIWTEFSAYRELCFKKTIKNVQRSQERGERYCITEQFPIIFFPFNYKRIKDPCTCEFEGKQHDLKQIAQSVAAFGGYSSIRMFVIECFKRMLKDLKVYTLDPVKDKDCHPIPQNVYDRVHAATLAAITCSTDDEMFFDPYYHVVAKLLVSETIRIAFNDERKYQQTYVVKKPDNLFEQLVLYEREFDPRCFP